jgi:hypothetical protein
LRPEQRRADWSEPNTSFFNPLTWLLFSDCIRYLFVLRQRWIQRLARISLVIETSRILSVKPHCNSFVCIAISYGDRPPALLQAGAFEAASAPDRSLHRIE